MCEEGLKNDIFRSARLVLMAYFPQPVSFYQFLFQLCSRSGPLFPSFSFTPVHSSVLFPKYFLRESYGINVILPVKWFVLFLSLYPSLCLCACMLSAAVST